ncbi:hypothetical protein ACFWIX_12345 [Pseudarthrobacter sp. NPDC058362]|uniref:hypothetical protein n=1 Tax=Pseudarthrobacter sp. NPDC058362 TaxID=3346458 RepID=UPI00364BB274
MTENQWPQTPKPASTDPYAADPYAADPYGTETGIAPETYAPPAAGTPGTLDASGTAGASRKDAAKEEASQVAGQAKSAAQDVAATAKEEAANVAAEAKASAQDLLEQARTGLSSQAGAQQQKAAEGIRNISSELHRMATAPDQPGVAADLVREAAQRTSTLADWLENRDPGSLLTEVQSFARNRPGTFLLLAAGAGVLAGRLTRGLTAGAPETSASQVGQGTAPRHYQPQQERIRQETVFAAGTDAGLFDEPTVGSGAPVSTSTLPGGTAEDTPLRYEDDPFSTDSTRAGNDPYGTQEGRHL